jgi:hypothetical protein
MKSYCGNGFVAGGYRCKGNLKHIFFIITNPGFPNLKLFCAENHPQKLPSYVNLISVFELLHCI